jgi:hypothetical protein
MSYKLRTGQIAILELLYKYRFGSRQLLANSLSINSGSSLYQKLEVLFKHGYIGRYYDTKLRLQGLPIAYYLLPKGVKTLQELPEHGFIASQSTRASYRNPTVGLDFIKDTLKVYELTQVLQAMHPGLKVFTKADMRRYSYFPEQLPDAFLSLPIAATKQPRRFFFDYVPMRTPNFAVIKRLIGYAEFFEDGGWDEVDGVPPVILLVIEEGKTEKYLQQLITNKFFRLGIADVYIYTSTVKSLSGEQTQDASIWSDVTDPEDLLSLES